MGFAHRLAVMINEHHPGLTYANLAVRGRRIRDVVDDQLPEALAMRPDLITVCIGMNDITRPGPGFDRTLNELDDLHVRLSQSGATVVTTTFPDIASILPVGRLLGVAGARGQRLDRDRGRPSRIPPRRPLRRAVDGRAGHLERRPCTRFSQGPHAVRGGGGRGAGFTWEQPRLGGVQPGRRAAVSAFAAVLASTMDAQHVDAVALARGARPVRRRWAGTAAAAVGRSACLEAQDPQRDRRLPVADR